MLDSNIHCGARVLHEVNAPTQIHWCIGDRFDIPAIDLPQKVWYCVLGFVGSLRGIGLLAEYNSSRVLRFVQFPTFVLDWKRLRLGDEALQALVRELIHHAPDRCPVIEQTGGLRKLRFSPPGSGRGLGTSQAMLPAFLGVNVNTLRSWEQGKRIPQPIASRFLSEIESDIAYWRQRVEKETVGRESGKRSKRR